IRFGRIPTATGGEPAIWRVRFLRVVSATLTRAQPCISGSELCRRAAAPIKPYLAARLCLPAQQTSCGRRLNPACKRLHEVYTRSPRQRPAEPGATCERSLLRVL